MGHGLIELNRLECHLWEAANILRGPVDAANFKTYIFPLLFFKHLCDVYDEEIDSALEESCGDMVFALFPENRIMSQTPPRDCRKSLLVIEAWT
jgi:type I restriction enzyme M protein